MTIVKLHASTILTALGDAQSALVGKAVILTDGKAGTVENIWLDELHGLRISIRGHDGKWPISTIKMQQGAENHGGARCERSSWAEGLQSSPGKAKNKSVVAGTFVGWFHLLCVQY